MSSVDQQESASRDALLTEKQFSELGLDEVCYLRVMRTDDLTRIYGARSPSIMEIASTVVYVLMDAEGTPLVLGGSEESIRASAEEEGLTLIPLQ